MDVQSSQIQDADQKWQEARPILRGMGIILLAVGVFFLGNGLYIGAEKYKKIRQWTAVDATVLDFKIVNEPCGRASNCYRASVTFQYEIQGRALTSGVQSEYAGSYSSEIADWRLYVRGSHQQVRYNPLQPQELTADDVDVRSFREPLKFLGWGAGLILVGLALRR